MLFCVSLMPEIICLPSFQHSHLSFLIFQTLHTKLLQLCLTLCYPMDQSPPGSSVPMDSSLPSSSVRGVHQEKKYWSGLLCPPPGDLPNPGTEPVSFMSPALAGGFFTNQRHLGSPCVYTQMYVSVCVCVYHPTCQTLYIIARLYCHMEFVI